MPRRLALLAGLLLAVAPLATLPASAAGGDTRVTTGSPHFPFPRNKQNEPYVAVDAHDPSVLAAGANEEVDLAPCAGSSCPFTPGVGVSGVYFSFDGGATWTQPTYTGWSARSGTPKVGPIGTLPGYFEAGLSSDGDPELAFGPRPGPHGFSWANGSRLYYGNLTANFPGKHTFNAQEAIAVSRADDLRAAAAGDQHAWMPPVIVSTRLHHSIFSDKENVWADNAASSRFFGNVYACWISFREPNETFAPIVFSYSTDGGTTWAPERRLSPTINNAQNGRQGCTVRSDSHGIVYVFWEGVVNGRSHQFLTRSFDGGVHFEAPRSVADVVDVGAFDPEQGTFTFDGVVGARTDSFPIADIANGAPGGTDASDTIALAWSDARRGLNHEEALVSLSRDGGASWSAPRNAAAAGDRPDFTAVAISPNGGDLYVTYDAFLTPWRAGTAAPRTFQGVVRHADLGAGGAPGAWSTLHRGATGDARASSANALTDEFLGDYNAAVATRTFGAAVWNDARNAVFCPAIETYRQSLLTSTPLPAPAPGTACPRGFGDTDIFGGAYPDPTP